MEIIMLILKIISILIVFLWVWITTAEFSNKDRKDYVISFIAAVIITPFAYAGCAIILLTAACIWRDIFGGFL